MHGGVKIGLVGKEPTGLVFTATGPFMHRSLHTPLTGIVHFFSTRFPTSLVSNRSKPKLGLVFSLGSSCYFWGKKGRPRSHSFIYCVGWTRIHFSGRTFTSLSRRVRGTNQDPRISLIPEFLWSDADVVECSRFLSALVER